MTSVSVSFRALAVALALGAGVGCAATGAFAAAELSETDLAALRYFLSVGDAASVEAEVARLELEFPGADVEGALAAIEGRANEVDTSPIWREIEAGNWAAARAAIATIRTERADWTPPADMVAVLDGNEGQERFDAAVAAADLDGAIAALAAFPTILTCDRINNPWRLAELQVRADRKADALATYDGILRVCHQEDFVVATIYKANEIAEPAELDPLFALARAQNPGLGARIAALETELGRGAAAASGGSGGGSAGGSGGGAPAPRVAAASTGSGGGGSASASRAKAAADRGDWAQCLAITQGATAVDAVNQRAWCAFNFGRPREALADFRRVAQAAGGTMARDATYGMILAYAKLGDANQAAALASRTQLTAQQRAVVNKTVIAKLAVASFEAGRNRQAIEYLDRLSRETGSLDRGLAMLRGWALLKSGNKSAAREQFRRIHAASPGSDSLQGLRESR